VDKQFGGIAASGGIVIGPARKLLQQEINVPVRAISDGEIEPEGARFRDAVEQCSVQLREMITQCEGGERAEILEAHLTILEDPYLKSVTLGHIAEHMNAEQALSTALEEICAMFESVDDEALRERVDDFRDEASRILRRLMAIPEVGLQNLTAPVIIIAKDLSPSETAVMDFEHILGFATELGGRTSHIAIMARGMDIPAVVGAGAGLYDAVNDGDIVILDGITGEILIAPSAEETALYAEKQEIYLAKRRELAALRDLPAETVDGHVVKIAANIGSQQEAKAAIANGATGIGLLRTEFLYMNARRWPSEDEQFAVYRNIVKMMNNQPVIIRTLDIGGDKTLAYYTFPPEENPFLGHRAIRFCLSNPDVFRIQLRAILRASAFGRVSIMFPMVISVEEILAAKELLRTCIEELAAEKVAHDSGIEVGIMVETPAAVLLAEQLAAHVDFFSIGTNDLTQYILAADRGNEKIQQLYNPLHPAVLRAIQHIIKMSHKAGIWTGMCGELAGDLRATQVLLGMGLDEFSVSPSAVPDLKKQIRAANYQDLMRIADEVAGKQTAQEIEEYLVSLN
jgi:phosphoenolpyruvate-protein phosphotransferase